MAQCDFDAIIALGSNIGDKQANIAHAIDGLQAKGDVRVLKRSADYRTEPWGIADQDWFVNACVGVATAITPQALLGRCLEIEQDMGRERTVTWGPRIIDLDLLVYRDRVMSTPELTLPHPRIAERAFVLVPLCEIAPDLVVAGVPAARMLAAVDASGVRRLHTAAAS